MRSPRGRDTPAPPTPPRPLSAANHVGRGPAGVLPGRAVGSPPPSFLHRLTGRGHADETEDLVWIPVFPAAALGPLWESS